LKIVSHRPLRSVADAALYIRVEHAVKQRLGPARPTARRTPRHGIVRP
jgi:hypothetical protein